MFRLNTMQTAGAQAQASLKLDNYPDGFVAGALLFRFAYPLTITPGGGNTPPTMLALITAALGSFTLRHGATGQRVAYSTVPGNEMRNVHRFITREDLPNNIAAIDWSTSMLTSYIATFDLLVPFAVEELTDGRARCPGWSQMRTMIIDLVEGAAFSGSGGNVVRTPGAQLLIDVDVLTYPSELDRSGPVLSYYRSNQAALRAQGPDGVQLAAWEVSAPQASTQITLFSMNVSAREFVRTAPPYIAGDKYSLNWDTGISPITDEVTIAWCPDEGQSSADLQSGVVDYVQASQDVPLLQLRGLWWPPMDVPMARELVRLGAQASGGPVLGALNGLADVLPGNVARTLPMEMHRPSQPGFVLQPGLLAPDVGTEPFLAIPETVSQVHGAQVTVASVSGAETTVAKQSQILDTLSRKIPGLAQTTHGDRQTKAPSDPSAYVRALETVSGSKGAQSLKTLKSSMKL